MSSSNRQISTQQGPSRPQTTNTLRLAQTALWTYFRRAFDIADDDNVDCLAMATMYAPNLATGILSDCGWVDRDIKRVMITAPETLKAPLPDLHCLPTEPLTMLVGSTRHGTKMLRYPEARIPVARLGENWDTKWSRACRSWRGDFESENADVGTARLLCRTLVGFEAVAKREILRDHEIRTLWNEGSLSLVNGFILDDPVAQNGGGHTARLRGSVEVHNTADVSLLGRYDISPVTEWEAVVEVPWPNPPVPPY